MKKSLIALAVAGAMTAPIVAQADATVYGSLRVKAIEADTDGGSLNIGDNASRIGIRGKQETGIDGVTATYRGEWKVISGGSGDFGAGRLAYVGLNTDAGNINFGRQWTPAFLMVASMVDILDTSSNPTHDYSAGAEGRQAQALSYTSPLMGGFRIAGAVAMTDDSNSGTTADEDTIDWYNIAAKFAMSGFEVAASQTSNEMTDKDITSFGASFTMDALYVAGYYSDNENKAVTADETFEVVASYDIGNVKLLANYVDFDKEGNQVAVEAWYKLGSKARAFVNVTSMDSDAEAAGKTDSWGFGYRVDF